MKLNPTFILILALTLTGCTALTTTTPIEESSLIEVDSNGTARHSVNIMEVIPTPGDSRAQQGITRHPDGSYFMSQNKHENNKTVSYLFHVSSDLGSVVSQFKIIPEEFTLWDNNYRTHLGQIAINPDDGYLYVPIMDTAAGSPRTGLLRFDTDLNFLGWIDTTSFSPYIDALAFDGEYIWIDYSILCRFKWAGVFDWENKKLTSPSSQWEWTRFDRDTDRFSTSQGMQVRDGKIYLVPECDPVTNRTEKGYTGIAVYDISSLIERPKSGDKIVNYPQKVHYFELPEDNYADHEAFDFISDTRVIISSARGNGDTLWVLQI